jgi:hypothetical protein
MERGEYQARVLGELRWRLLDSDGRAKTLDREGTGSRVVVEEVRLGDPSDGGMVVVLYRDLRRPECLFGWRMEAMEPEDETEIWATIVWANFLEHVIGTPHGLPAECSGKGITWTG